MVKFIKNQRTTDGISHSSYGISPNISSKKLPLVSLTTTTTITTTTTTITTILRCVISVSDKFAIERH
ncbi:hypothetical protein GQX74_008341, partial [Glossina fuscipes]